MSPARNLRFSDTLRTVSFDNNAYVEDITAPIRSSSVKSVVLFNICFGGTVPDAVVIHKEQSVL